ncbi:MAG: helix-turn-helix domain-containing protein [Desulfobacteraceae bacterium]|nr:helix-turn-helix domain-containing protein [Desulfobacteraceae bacterium]
MSYPVRTVPIQHLNWLNLVFSAELPPYAKLIASYLSTYMNARNQCAWPSIARISAECSIARRSVFTHLDELENSGWLSRKSGGQHDGKNIANLYTITVPPTSKDGGVVQELHGGGAGAALPVVQELHPNLQDKSTKTLKDTVKTASFTDFWKLWPRKVAKREAAKAWKKLSPTELMFVAMVANLEAHANAGDWSDPQYIPHPATWLNGRRWEDAVHPVKDKTPGDHNPPEQNFTSEKQTESRRWRDKLKDRQLGYPL